MDVYKKITDLTIKYPNMVVALGMFDGVHAGHQSIIRHAVSLANELNGKAIVFTFANHPLSVLAPPSLPPQIGGEELRELRMRKLGVDAIVSVPFDAALAQIKPEAFLQLLQKYFKPKYVVTGENYTFGVKGQGDQALLKKLGPKYGFRPEICQDVLVNGRHVSSTRIRSLIDAGELAAANKCLGYPFTIVGEVRHGDERGRTIGFPTANLAIEPQRVMLPNGVYVVKVVYAGKVYAGMANIGDNPTFTGCYRRIEVNIHEFAQNIYGKKLEVSFLKNLRNEVKFSSVDELVKQLTCDKEAVEKYWQQLK